MSQAYAVHPFRSEQRKKQYRTLSLICEDESLSDVQLKAYQTRLQEYRTFLDSVSRLALCGNVCVTEEAVIIGEHGLLTGESLNALQHAGAISVYNTLQQNNWEYPVSEEGEAAIIKAHIPVQDEFLDSEKPIRSDWPAVHISECFVEGERAKLHGSVRPLRTFLPPTIVFRNAADVDEDIPEAEVNIINSGPDGNVEIVHSSQGLCVRKPRKNGKEQEYIPIDEYYFGRQNGYVDYIEDKEDFRFKCAVCQRLFYSNTKLMSHILGHVDEISQACLDNVDSLQCSSCDQLFISAFDLRDHVDKEHGGMNIDPKLAAGGMKADQLVAQSASQLLMQQRAGDPNVESLLIDGLGLMGPNLNGLTGSISCRICGKAATSHLTLAHHLQSTHRQWEMPYVCRLCLFRSSMFEDLLDHFKKVHDNSNHLLCTYCLRIFTPSDARVTSTPTQCVSATGGVSTVGLGSGVGQTQVYLQHLRMHQVKHQVKRCPSCRLNFTNKSDYQVHRRLDHKATRGTNTDRQETRLNIYESESFNFSNDQSSTSKDVCATETAAVPTNQIQQESNLVSQNQPHITLMNAPEAGCAKNLNVNVLPENIREFDCLECGKCLDSTEHTQYLPCSVCRFATCCSMGFRRHIQQTHAYPSKSQFADLDAGMPMIHPLFFEWTNKSTNEDGLDESSIKISELNKDTELSTNLEVDKLDITDLTPDVPISDAAAAVAIEGDITTVITNNDQPKEDPLIHDNDDAASIHQDSLITPIEQYMDSLPDSRLFYCSHCVVNTLDGNSLARHLVEECGTLTATINPDPALILARIQAEEQGAQQHDNGILFEATDQSVILANENTQLLSSTSVSDGDMIMMSVDPNQLTSMGFVEGQENVMMADNQILTSSNAGGTTIDVTDAGGEVVQQFILPDDLQLEEGQTLVMIHGEDGQPQLAIVNQADLIGANDSQVLIQGEEGQVVYTNGMDAIAHPDAILGREDEKENHQFIV